MNGMSVSDVRIGCDLSMRHLVVEERWVGAPAMRTGRSLGVIILAGYRSGQASQFEVERVAEAQSLVSDMTTSLTGWESVR